jgi:hypothetical protein
MTFFLLRVIETFIDIAVLAILPVVVSEDKLEEVNGCLLATATLSLPKQVLKSIADILPLTDRFVLLEIQILSSWPARIATIAVTVMGLILCNCLLIKCSNPLPGFEGKGLTC